MNPKITIKDIAKRAGVSIGTVDRVLHKRPNVSESALTRVNKVLAELNYQPNVYASALASKRSCSICMIMPKHESEAYWEEVEEGACHCVEVHRDFNINVCSMYYNRFNEDTFVTVCRQCMEKKPDGVILVPATLNLTRTFTDKLHEDNIPFIMLDSYMPDLHPLAFYGQDSFASGCFAARMMSLIAAGNKEIMLMKQTIDGRVASKQQDNREVGFRHYMKEHFPHVKISVVDLPLTAERESYNAILEEFFCTHPDVRHCITFNSKAHIVGEFLANTNRQNIQIIGYDMVAKNADCLRKGSISFLIAQHGYMQGYNCIDALFRAIVLKTPVNSVNYMPIEMLTKENVDFYQRKMI